MHLQTSTVKWLWVLQSNEIFHHIAIVITLPLWSGQIPLIPDCISKVFKIISHALGHPTQPIFYNTFHTTTSLFGAFWLDRIRFLELLIGWSWKPFKSHLIVRSSRYRWYSLGFAWGNFSGIENGTEKRTYSVAVRITRNFLPRGFSNFILIYSYC